MEKASGTHLTYNAEPVVLDGGGVGGDSVRPGRANKGMYRNILTLEKWLKLRCVGVEAAEKMREIDDAAAYARIASRKQIHFWPHALPRRTYLLEQYA